MTSDNSPSPLAVLIEAKRKEFGCRSEAELARRIGVHKNTLSRAKRILPDLRVLRKLAAGLRVPVSQLVPGDRLHAGHPPGAPDEPLARIARLLEEILARLHTLAGVPAQLEHLPERIAQAAADRASPPRKAPGGASVKAR